MLDTKSWIFYLACWFPVGCNKRWKESVVRVINKLYAHKNVIALLFLMLAEKDLKQWEMATEDNKQKQRWWHKKIVDRAT